MSSILSAFLPIIIILMIVGIVIFTSKIGKGFFSIKMTHWLFIIYVAVLVIATAIVPFISDDTMDREVMKQEDIDQEINDLFSLLHQGEINQIQEDYLLQSNHFENYEHPTLTISSQTDYGPEIFVERKTDNDGSIESFTYANGLLIGGINFSNKRKPISLEMVEDTLTIKPISQEIRVSILSSSFPIRQFTGESMLDHSFSTGNQVIYLKVPGDLKIIAEEQVNLVYVES